MTRYFSTVVLVDGSPNETWINIFKVPSSGILPEIAPIIPQLVTAQPSGNPPPPKVNVGAIVGGVVGGVAVICLTILGALMIVRRNRSQPAAHDPLTVSTVQPKAPDTATVAGAPAVMQPYSPSSTTSPVQPHEAGMPPPGAYTAPNAPAIATSGHVNTSAHELGA